MPVPTHRRPPWRCRLSSIAFSRKISRTVPSGLIRYREFSPLLGVEGAGAGTPLLSFESAPGEEGLATPAVESTVGVSLPKTASTGVPGALLVEPRPQHLPA